MRIFIAGAGRAGLAVATHLSAAGHAITIVDRDHGVIVRAREQHGLVALTGDATDTALMHDAEMHRADVVVALLRRDADNLAIAMMAMSQGVKRVLVRMRDPEYREVYRRAGVDTVLSEIEVFIGALAIAVEFEAVRHAMLLGGGESVAFELEVPADSSVAGRTVVEVASEPGFPQSCVFAGLVAEDGRIVAPRGSSVVRGGGAVLLVSSRAEVGEVVRWMQRRR